MENKNIINQNNVKATLQGNEIKRFHQVSENFLKGSHHFMVQFQDSIIKSVDTKILHNDFIEQYQNNLESYRKDVLEKVKAVEAANKLKEENAKKSIFNTILNFVIAAEVAVLAFTLMPKQMKALGTFASNIIDGVGDEIARVWRNIDFSAAWDVVKNIAGEHFYPIAELVVGWFWEFFNGEDNVFTKCMYALAKSIIQRGHGPLQWMLQFAYSFLAIEGISKPDIKHWLIYGPEVYNKIKSVEDNLFNTIEGTIDTSSSFFDISNAEIGYVTYDDDGNKVYMGADEGTSWFKWIGTSKELEDVKNKLKEQNRAVQAASQKVNTTERVENLYAVPNLLDTDEYRELEKTWEDLSTDDVDIQAKWGDVDFKDLTVNLAAKAGQEPKKMEELRKAYDAVRAFRKKHAGTRDPFAQQIFKEIQDKLDGYHWGEDSYEIPMPLFMFLPAIYYSILQFEFVEQRNEKLVAALGREMKFVSLQAERHLAEDSKDEFEHIGEDVKSGRMNLSDYARRFIDFIDKFYQTPTFSFADINFKAELDSKFVFFSLGETILKGFNKLKLITQSHEKFKAGTYIEVSKDDMKSFGGEIQIGSEEVLVEKLVSSDRKLKEKIKNNYIRRKHLVQALFNALQVNLVIGGNISGREMIRIYGINDEIRNELKGIMRQNSSNSGGWSSIFN